MGDPRPLNQTLRALIAFQCVVLAPIVVWARPITELLLGSRYSQSAEVLRALAPFVFFAGLAPLVVRAAGGPEVSPRVSIYAGTLAIAVAAGFILIPRRGVVGGAIAADIAIGFYVLAYIWVCRRRFDLRIRTLVWALASSLTAAAAMGIVLASVGTKDLTLADWLIGCFGGLAAYVAMLIFTRELTTAQIARAASVVTARLTGLKPSPRQDVPLAAAPSPNHPGSTPLVDDLATPRRGRDRDANDADQGGHAGLTYRGADAAGGAAGAFNLGVLLHQRRDFAAAAGGV